MLVQRSDGLYAGHPYVWADWGLHTALIQSFVQKPPTLWFNSHPLYAGYPLNYPFMVNLLSAGFMKAGLSLIQATLMPSFVFSILLLIFLYGFNLFISKQKKIATLAMLLFLCSGGLGAWMTWRKEKSLEFLSDSTILMTQDPEQKIEFTNIIMGMLVPQRAFLIGMPVGLLVLWVASHILYNRKLDKKWLLLAGLLAGLLPITHTHTFITVVLICAWWFLFSWKRVKEWLWFGIPAGVLSSILYLIFIRSTVSPSTFFSWHPGWSVQTGVGDWITFWMRNWGTFIPLSFVGVWILWSQKKFLATIVALSWWMLFLVANLIQFQPQTWDNSKLLAWSYLGLSFPAAITIQYIYRQNIAKVGKILAILLLFLSCISGAIDVIHLLDFERKTFRMLSSDEIELGQWVQKNTPAHSTFFTPEVVNNPIAAIGGRSVYMGYSGWMFNYGFNYGRRQQEITSFYENGIFPTTVASNFPEFYLYIPASEFRKAPTGVQQVYKNDAGVIYKVTK